MLWEQLILIQRRVVTEISTSDDFGDAWDGLTRNATPEAGVLCNSACATLEWTVALWKTHLVGAPLHVTIVEEEGQALAIFPCFRQPGWGTRMLGADTLISIQELYLGRVGLLVSAGRDDAIDVLLNANNGDSRRWSRITLSVLEGSVSQTMLEAAIKRNHLNYRVSQAAPSPYIELPPSKDEYFNSLDKGFRKKLRQRERNWAALDGVTLRIFRDAAEVDILLAMIEKVERASWKEREGTSITANPRQKDFYRAMLPSAASRGWLRTLVLMHEDEPVAYQLGLAFNNVYECLKTSYNENYVRFGPGNIIMQRLIELLYEENIRYCDLQGLMDDFKSKWTSTTYRHLRYVIYANNVAGWASRMGATIKTVFNAGAHTAATD